MQSKPQVNIYKARILGDRLTGQVDVFPEDHHLHDPMINRTREVITSRIVKIDLTANTVETQTSIYHVASWVSKPDSKV